MEEMGLELGDKMKNSVLDILDLICLLDIKKGSWVGHQLSGCLQLRS